MLWSHRVLLAALALTPAYLIQLHAGRLPTSALEILIVAGLLLFAADLRLGRVSLRPWALAWPATALMLTGALAILWSPDRYGALGLYRAYIAEPVLAAYALHSLTRAPGQLRVGLAAAACGGAIAAAAQIVTAVAQSGRWSSFDVLPPTGLYENANFTALLVGPALMIVLAFALAREERARRNLWTAAGALLALGMLLSYSRGGYLGTAAGVITVALLSSGTRWRELVVAALAALVAVAAVPSLRERVLHELNPSDPHNTGVSRIPIWRAALQMIRDHPVTGIGIRSFAAKLRAYAPGVTETHDHPHDTVLNLWLSIGILGLLAYVWVWVETLRTCAAGMRTASSRPVFVAGIAVLVTVLAHGLVDTSLWKNDLALQFWGVLAMVTAARGTAPEVAVAA